MSTHFRTTILVVAALAAAADLPRTPPPDPPDSTDSSRPTLKTPGTPSGAEPGSEKSGPSGNTPSGNTEDAPAAPSRPPSQPALSSAPAPAPAPAPATPAPSASAKPLQDASRLQIIRNVDGEFAKAARALPGKAEGFTIFVGKSIDEQKMSDALRLQGTAINLGEPVQITQIDFEAKRIVVQLNGGTKK